MTQEKTPRKPLVVAHRGASASAPENTLAAFKRAREVGADGIELDVMLSADGELVVIHDATVDRTTDGTGKVGSLSLASLRELNAASRFAGSSSAEKIPLLSEVYEEIGSDMLINVELKNYASPFDDLTQKVVKLTQKFGLQQTVLLSSFNPLNLPKAKKLAPEIRRGLLTEPGKQGALLRGWVGRLFPYNAFHPYYQDLTRESLAACHQRGVDVNVWTVDDPVAIRRLADWGVDAIICNDPAAALKLLER